MPHITYVAKREGGVVDIGYQSEDGAYQRKLDKERRDREMLGEHHSYEVTCVVVWEVPKWLRRFIK